MTLTRRTGKRRLAMRALVGTAAISAGSFMLVLTPHAASGEEGLRATGALAQLATRIAATMARVIEVTFMDLLLEEMCS